MTASSWTEPRDVPFFAWILRVARNVALDHLRQRRPVLCDEAGLVDDRCEEAEHDRLVALKEALAELPDEQREVLVLRHVGGLSPGEIASRLGRSEASIHGLHHRGRRTLKGSLTASEAAPLAWAG